MTHADAADALGPSRAAITSALRLPRARPPVQDLLREESSTWGTPARCLPWPA